MPEAKDRIIDELMEQLIQEGREVRPLPKLGG
jgi:hypothetical protein